MKKFLSYFGAILLGLAVAAFVLWTDGSDSTKIWMTAAWGSLFGVGYVYTARMLKVNEATMSNWAGAIVFAVAMITTLLSV